MFGWLRRRGLSAEGQRRLLLALARAEESLLETHVHNALDVIASVGNELPLERALDEYLRALDPGELRASLIARRVLARLESSTRSLEARSPAVRRLRRSAEE